MVNISQFSDQNMQKIIFSIFISIILAIFLTSCTSVTSKKDGPPNFYVDASKVPNAVPKAEPLSKYGNYKSYIVFGKRYYTMKSSKHYDQVGIASWYGTKFHERKTSNGERYDMLAMTAAHKTLPLPTYVEVTNLKNHKTIVVKVNDRGPFAENRIIDLSYVAAKKLGMTGRGTALVRVKAIDPETYGKPVHYFAKKKTHNVHIALKHQDKPIKTHGLYLQVGSFRNKSNAMHLKKQLTALLKTPVKISHFNSKGLYQVKVGPIHDTLTANKTTYQLKNLGLHYNRTDG